MRAVNVCAKIYFQVRRYIFQGPGNERNHFMYVHITSFGVFEDAEACRSKFIPEIYKFITTNTLLEKEDILTHLNKTEPFLIGYDGNAVG